MNIEKLSLDQLRVLVVAVEEGTFSGAARRLNRAQSAVTYTIQQLEQQLGVEVFDRSGYRPKLNAAGESILEDARVILARADSLIAKAGAQAAGLEESIAITVDVMTPFDSLARVLRDFDTTFPTVTLRLHVEAMGEVVRHLTSEIADLALLCSLALAPDNVTLYGIGHVTLVPVASPIHPLSRLDGPIPLETLHEHRQIVLADRSELSKGQDFNVYSPQTWRVSDLGSKHALLLAGLGFGQMPTHMIEEDLELGRLRTLTVPAHPSGGDRLPIYCAHRADLAMGRATRWLVDRFRRFESP